MGLGLFGTARATYAPGGSFAPENRWEIPAAWSVVVRDGRIAEWQVYADNSPVYRILEAARRTKDQKPKFQ